jgi:hypothetical protein
LLAFEVYVGESLFKKQLGFIDRWPRTAIPSGFDVARELHENSNTRCCMNIGIRSEPL